MATVLNRRTLPEMHNFFRCHETRNPYVRNNQEAFRQWLGELNEGPCSTPLIWVEYMTFMGRTFRPSCEVLIPAMHEAQDFWAPCCSPGSDAPLIPVNHPGETSNPVNLLERWEGFWG